MTDGRGPLATTPEGPGLPRRHRPPTPGATRPPTPTIMATATADSGRSAHHTPDGFTVEETDDGFTVTLPDATRVEVPHDFADRTFTSEAARLSLNRRFPTFRRVQRSGQIVDAEVRPDPFVFDGGVFPVGRELTITEYAELVSHPFARKFTAVPTLAELAISEALAAPAPVPQSIGSIIDQLQAAAAAGNEEARFALGYPTDEPRDNEGGAGAGLHNSSVGTPIEPDPDAPDEFAREAEIADVRDPVSRDFHTADVIDNDDSDNDDVIDNDPEGAAAGPAASAQDDQADDGPVVFGEIGKGDVAAAVGRLKAHAEATGQQLDDAALKTAAGNLSVVQIRDAAANLGASFPNL